MRWGTVTAISPLRVTLDGDTAAVPFAPDSLVDPLLLAVNDRVRCELADRRLVIHGRSGGLDALGLRDVLEFTSSGTFSKGDYPWLRAIRVKCQGGGGAGGGAPATSANNSCGAGGGGGGYAESLLTDIASLAEDVTVTVGAGGSRSSGAAGGNGGNSSFGSTVVGNGGAGGATSGPTTGTVGAGGGVGGGGTGDIVVSGGNGGPRLTESALTQLGAGGQSALAPLRPPTWNARGSDFTANGLNNTAGYGGGGSGGGNRGTQAATTGGAGGAGIVIVELYA